MSQVASNYFEALPRQIATLNTVRPTDLLPVKVEWWMMEDRLVRVEKCRFGQTQTETPLTVFSR